MDSDILGQPFQGCKRMKPMILFSNRSRSVALYIYVTSLSANKHSVFFRDIECPINAFLFKRLQ